MSPQAAVPSHRISHRVSLVESDDNSFLSSLIEAADEAYQKTSDESLPSLSAAAEVHAGPGRVANQNNKNTNSNRPARFNLRKRKVVSVSGTSCAGSLSAVNTDFLSGLFADLEQTAPTDTATDANVQEDEEHYVTDGESCPNTPVPSPRKRARLGRTLSRCTKSYVSLSSVLRTNSTDSYVQKFQEQCTKIGGTSSHRGKAARALPTLPADDELTSTSVKPTAPHGVASDVLADSLTAAAALADAVFPHLPHTVSDSPLRKSPRTASQNIISADLTAQPSASSTEASSGCVAEPLHVAPELTLAEAFFGTAEAEGSEDGGPASAAVTSTCTEADESSSGKGDSFGWFLDLDTPTDASEEHITDAYADGNGSGSSSSLAFQAPVSVANHDAEVEWAKAADTVDDVLGDLPF